MIAMNRVRALAAALLGVVLVAPSVRAQAGGGNAIINGVVNSEFGRPIEAANVYITEMSISVPTGADGKFTINIPAARVSGQQVTLRVRAIGQEPGVKPIRITAGTQTFNFDMKTDINRLDEVVVTGVVGEGVERSKVPFAVAHLSTEDLPVPAMDPISALAGKVAGMRIAGTSGAPGSPPQIQLRGVTSINSANRSTAPLIIVDGAIMNNISNLTELGGLDIESVEVVKGAAGASLYGTRAANGVIQIKTKRGGSGSDAVVFNARTEYGLSDLSSIQWGMPLNSALNLDETGKQYCVVGSSNVSNCSRSIDWMTEVLRLNGVKADTTRAQTSLQNAAPAIATGELQNTYQATPWVGKRYDALSQLSQSNPTTLSQIDATGKMGSARFYVAGSYQSEQGAFKGLVGNNQRRGRVNLDYDARSDLTVSVSSLYDNGYNDNKGPGFGSLLRAQPGTNYLATDSLNRPILLTAPKHSPAGNGDTNPYYANSGTINNYDLTTRWLGNISTRYYPVDWATLEGTFAYDNRQRTTKNYAQKGFRTTTLSTAANSGNIAFQNFGDESYNGNVTATFRKQLKSDLRGQFQVRGLFDQENQNTIGSTGQIFSVKDIYTTSNTNTNKNATSSAQTIKNVGVLTGANIDYKDRYVLDGTFRYDGSSLFGSGNRWAPFGRVAAVWRIGQEPWFNLPHVADLRFRASHGTAGSTPSFAAQYEVYNVSNGNITLGQAGNAKLKPETTTEDEMGTDFTLFGRLGTEFTYAQSTTKDQILNVDTPNSLGFSKQWQNAGQLSNKTFEVALNLPVLNKKDLTWSMRGTWDRTRTYVDKLMTPDFTLDGGTSQGTTTYFHITAQRGDTGVANGMPLNRFGNIWGRKFYRKCSDMPSSLQGQCTNDPNAAAGQYAYQVNGDRYVVWVGQGNTWRDGITKNLWVTKMTTGSPFGSRIPLYWGMPIIDRPLAGQPGEGVGKEQVLGNAFPDFRWTYANNISYKRLTLYGLFDATWGQEIYNQGEGWGLLDFSSRQFDSGSASVENAKPTGYSYRAGGSESTGIGGFYDLLEPNNYAVEDGSFIKLREVSVSYHIGAVRKLGDWSAGLIGRNLKTWTKYSGLDPEVGSSTGTADATSSLTNSTDAFGYPNVRTFTLFLSTRF
jgi:TonB-linked SusC/RagA family outer membrane protein